MQTYTCDHCKKEYQTYAAWRKKHVHGFCSRSCKYEWNKTLTGHWKGKKMPESAKQKMRENHADFRGEKNGRWKGGRRVDKDGYVLLHLPDHPYRDYHGYVREHRIAMEKHIGRHLLPDEVVHHIDQDKLNNDISNLQIMTPQAHMSLHSKERWESQ